MSLYPALPRHTVLVSMPRLPVHQVLARLVPEWRLPLAAAKRGFSAREMAFPPRIQLIF